MSRAKGGKGRPRQRKNKHVERKPGSSVLESRETGAPSQPDLSGLVQEEAAGPIETPLPRFQAASSMDDEGTLLDQPRRRKTGPLGQKPDVDEVLTGEITSPPSQTDNLEPPPQRKTGPLVAQADAELPQSPEEWSFSKQRDDLELHRRRKTGPLGSQLEQESLDVPEVEPSPPKASASEEPRPRKTGPLGSKPEADQPDSLAISPFPSETSIPEEPRRRKTGPLGSKLDEEETFNVPETAPLPSEISAPGESRPRKTGPLSIEPDADQPEPGEIIASSVETEDIDQSRRRKTGPLAGGSSSHETESNQGEKDRLKRPRRRKTGPLQKNLDDAQAASLDLDSRPAPVDQALYRCLSCGKQVIGFAREDHIRGVHGGRDPGFLKLESDPSG